MAHTQRTRTARAIGVVVADSPCRDTKGQIEIGPASLTSYCPIVCRRSLTYGAVELDAMSFCAWALSCNGSLVLGRHES